MKVTASPTLLAANEAIKAMWKALDMSASNSNLTPDIIAFEDAMNGLSGAILGLELSVQLEIQIQVEAITVAASGKGYEVHLYKSLLPADVSRGTSSPVYVQGKKLYPLTTSALIATGSTITDSATVSGASTGNVTSPFVTFDANVISSLTSDTDDIDEIFAENELDVVIDEPLSTIQNETAPYLSNSLIALAQTAAANTGGLQDGLATFSHNPLATLITTTKDLFLYYTQGNYANLNIALTGISSDVALAAEYKSLRESIGGPDGLAGCVAQMDFFREHTDRLSGLILDVDSPNDVTDNDSTDEYINVNDVASGVATIIFSFDSRYFRSAKYLVQATGGSLDRGHQATELVILHDNYQAYTREIVSVYSQDPFITFSTRLLNNRVEVLANTSVSNTDFVIHGIRLRIARAAAAYGEMSQKKIIEQHELLQAYLDDGVDYVAQQSASLTAGGGLVGELGREFNDMLINFSNGGFLGQSTGAKQVQILAMAETIKTRRAAIQTQMAADYAKFVEIQKLTESLDIAYNLSVAYTDSTGNTIPALTLNTSTIAAINEQE